MSSGEVRKVSRQEIQLVQNLIERCLQLYMSQKEVVDTLLVQAKIEPGFTELVWQKLEEENQEFFREYYLRLVVKDQIVKFNSLLARQIELMHQTLPAEVASIHLPNGSPIPAMHQNSALYAPEHSGLALQPENMPLPVANSLPNAFINGGSSLDSCMQTGVDMPTRAGRIDVLPNLLLAQNSNVGIIQGANGGMLNSETGYVGSSQFMFGADGNVPEMCPAIGDASVSSFGGGESNSQQQNGTLLDSNSSLFGFLGRIPRNLSLTDLTADFSNSSDIFDYSGSPFLAAETDNFFNNHGRGEHQGDVRRLETVPECLTYEEFGTE